jgi:hypothetical protein
MCSFFSQVNYHIHTAGCFVFVQKGTKSTTMTTPKKLQTPKKETKTHVNKKVANNK